MIAEGALRAGCSFFAGYPITPSSGIYKSMIDRLPERGGVAMSAPDEISALAYCIGSSMRGFKSMTVTSGPGWSLMIESVQYAVMTETPVVIVVVQRLGPSTGGATQGAQGDILLTEFCTSGGYTLPVFSPSTPAEAYELTIHAFNWSELLRSPVILLTDKEVAMTVESVNYFQLHDVPVSERLKATGISSDGSRFQTYRIESPSDVPRFAPVGGAVRVVHTGSAHDMEGRLQKDTPETLRMLGHLEEKIRYRTEEMTVVGKDFQPGAETLVVSYGITARAARQAVNDARSQGLRVSFVNLKTLFPIPSRLLLRTAGTASHVVVPEENLNGQYRSQIEHLFPDKAVTGVNVVGRMVTPGEILGAIKEGHRS